MEGWKARGDGVDGVMRVIGLAALAALAIHFPFSVRTQWPGTEAEAWIVALQEGLEGASAPCQSILTHAREGFVRASETGSIYWCDDDCLQGDAGRMLGYGTPERGWARLWIHARLEEPDSTVTVTYQDTGEQVEASASYAVVHAGLHASLVPRYFGRHMTEAIRMATRADARACHGLVQHPGRMGSR